MKILNNYDELILSIDSKDTKRFETLLSYSDCRNELLNKYIQNFGIEEIIKLTQNIEAKALKSNLEKICTECKERTCKFSTQNLPLFEKRIFIHHDNVVSNLHSHNYIQFNN